MANQVIDIVYILGNESPWLNKEILYSLRSVEKNIRGYRKIFIVGHKPHFLNDLVTEIPYEDIYFNKARNIMHKVRRAAGDSRVSGNFMLLNDDYFIVEPISAHSYPYYWKCDLKESLQINAHNLNYHSHLKSTREALLSKGFNTKNFDTHYPIIYNKIKFRRVCAKYNWNVTAGYTMRSIYCNTLAIEGQQREDCKINHPHVTESWPRVNAARECFSIGDRSINTSLEKYLHRLFPNKSRYEL